VNSKTKRRLVVVTGIVVILIIIVLAVVGGSSAAKTITVAQAVDGSNNGQRVQVTGTVVDNSYSTEGSTLSFDVYDPDGDANDILHIVYNGSASSTFGNGVQAICTGTLSDDGTTLNCTELETKCPSKYENATEALTVSRLLEYGDSVVDKTVKVTGTIKAGTLADATSDVRFVVVDTDDTSVEMSVHFDGGIPEGVGEGTEVVLTGSLADDGTFTATDVAQKG
jgi:cytochrome c-type biogenesis protein CcmE